MLELTPYRAYSTASIARTVMALLTLLLGWGDSMAGGQCDAAAESTMKIVCEDPELLRLDEESRVLLEKAMEVTGLGDRLVKSQQLWKERERNLCIEIKGLLDGPGSEVRECIRDAYWRRKWVFDWYIGSKGTYPKKSFSETFSISALKEIGMTLFDRNEDDGSCQAVFEGVMSGEGVELVHPTLETMDWYDPELQKYVKDCPSERFVGMGRNLSWQPRRTHYMVWPHYAILEIEENGNDTALLYYGPAMSFPPYGYVDYERERCGNPREEFYCELYRSRYPATTEEKGRNGFKPYWLDGRVPIPREVRGGGAVSINPKGCKISDWKLSYPGGSTLERVVFEIVFRGNHYGLSTSPAHLAKDADIYRPLFGWKWETRTIYIDRIDADPHASNTCIIGPGNPSRTHGDK